MVAALFSLYHLSPAKTLYQFVVGAILSLLAFKSESLVPSLIVHFLNNLLIILNEYFAIFAFADGFKILTTIIGSIFLAAALVIVLTDKTDESSGRGETQAPYGFLPNALIGIVFAAALWIANLFV